MDRRSGSASGPAVVSRETGTGSRLLGNSRPEPGSRLLGNSRPEPGSRLLGNSRPEPGSRLLGSPRLSPSSTRVGVPPAFHVKHDRRGFAAVRLADHLGYRASGQLVRRSSEGPCVQFWFHVKRHGYEIGDGCRAPSRPLAKTCGSRSSRERCIWNGIPGGPRAWRARSESQTGDETWPRRHGDA
jgi:hypothetical protein